MMTSPHQPSSAAQKQYTAYVKNFQEVVTCKIIKSSAKVSPEISLFYFACNHRPKQKSKTLLKILAELFGPWLHVKQKVLKAF